MTLRLPLKRRSSQFITRTKAARLGSSGVAVREGRLRHSDVRLLVPLRHSQTSQLRAEVVMSALHEIASG